MCKEIIVSCFVVNAYLKYKTPTTYNDISLLSDIIVKRGHIHTTSPTSYTITLPERYTGICFTYTVSGGRNQVGDIYPISPIKGVANITTSSNIAHVSGGWGTNKITFSFILSGTPGYYWDIYLFGCPVFV